MRETITVLLQRLLVDPLTNMIEVAATTFFKGRKPSMAGRKDGRVENSHGGKLKPGESPRDCVVREVMEEFGRSIIIEPHELIFVATIRMDTLTLHHFAYPLLQEIDEVVLSDNQSSFAVVDLKEMRHLRAPKVPSFDAVTAEIAELLQSEAFDVLTGECVGCGAHGREGTGCSSCGGPIDPTSGEYHYYFGEWIDGPRP